MQSAQDMADSNLNNGRITVLKIRARGDVRLAKHIAVLTQYTSFKQQ